MNINPFKDTKLSIQVIIMSEECSLKRYQVHLSAFGENGEIVHLERINKCKCISCNHAECFEASIDEFQTEERLVKLITEACQVGDLELLKRINEYKELKIFMKITNPYCLKVIQFLREELRLEWSKDFIKNCLKGADYEVVRYALEDGCKCIGWRLKMLLHVYKKEIEKDEWMYKLFTSL